VEDIPVGTPAPAQFLLNGAADKMRQYLVGFFSDGYVRELSGIEDFAGIPGVDEHDFQVGVMVVVGPKGVELSVPAGREQPVEAFVVPEILFDEGQTAHVDENDVRVPVEELFPVDVSAVDGGYMGGIYLGGDIAGADKFECGVVGVGGSDVFLSLVGDASDIHLRRVRDGVCPLPQFGDLSVNEMEERIDFRFRVKYLSDLSERAVKERAVAVHVSVFEGENRDVRAFLQGVRIFDGRGGHENHVGPDREYQFRIPAHRRSDDGPVRQFGVGEGVGEFILPAFLLFHAADEGGASRIRNQPDGSGADADNPFYRIGEGDLSSEDVRHRAGVHGGCPVLNLTGPAAEKTAEGDDDFHDGVWRFTLC